MDIFRVGKHERMRTRTVHLVLFDGVQSLDVTGPLEVFAGANQWRTARRGRFTAPPTR